jgi:protein SCO1/2
MPRAPLIAALLALLIGGGAMLFALSQGNQANGPRAAGEVLGAGSKVGGPFTLTNAQGHEVSDKDFLGTPFIVYFGFTFCPDICPTELQALTAALDQLGPKAKAVKILFVTVDPERDTPSVIGDYAKAFGPQVMGLTGSAEQIAAAARAYGVFYQKVPLGDSGGDYTMDHTTAVYVMNRQGGLHAIFLPNQSPDDMAATIAKIL